MSEDLRPEMVCLDLEWVLVPEIWVGLAERTQIPQLRRTTRDEPDYDVLMRYRLDLLEQHRLGLADITAVIADLDPLPGAVDMLGWLRESFSAVVILSDTFVEFAHPLLRKLGFPALFCHSLVVEDDRITGYRLRMPDQKRASVQAFQGLGMRVLAAGDSYNDTSMLLAADAGILFDPPSTVVADFGDRLPVSYGYPALRDALRQASTRLI